MRSFRHCEVLGCFCFKAFRVGRGRISVELIKSTHILPHGYNQAFFLLFYSLQSRIIVLERTPEYTSVVLTEVCPNSF